MYVYVILFPEAYTYVHAKVLNFWLNERILD